MFLRRILLLLFLLMPLLLSAQGIVDAEQWIDDDGDLSAVGEQRDDMTEYRLHPININDTAALRYLPFFSPFQAQAVVNYLLLYGPMLTLDELLMVPGFDSLWLAQWRSILEAAPVEQPTRLRLTGGRHRIVVGTSGTDWPIYEPDSTDHLRTLFSYTYSAYRHLQLRVTADRDPGEPWGKDNFINFHLMLTDIGRVERLIVGRYNLHFGQGLTAWTGFRPFFSVGGGLMRFGEGVRTSSAFYEQGYQQGAAATLRLSDRWRLSPYLSWVDGQSVEGVHVEYRSGRLMVGGTLHAVQRDSATSSVARLYQANTYLGRQQLGAGVDWMYLLHRVLFYGEASVSENGRPAVVGGVRVEESNVRLSLAGRYFHPQFHNLMAQPHYATTLAGERGVTLEWSLPLPFGVRMAGNADLHYASTLRYQAYSPTYGSWVRTQLSRSWPSGWTATLRYALRRKEGNIPNSSSVAYLGQSSVRGQMQGEARWSGGRWTFSTRVAYTHYSTETDSSQQGWMVAAFGRYAASRWQVDMGGALFQVDGYYARIFLSESYLQYFWTMPALYGTGVRVYSLLRYQPSEAVQIALRASVARISRNERTATTPQLFVQMRFSF